jgi:hypothetical protein
MYRRLFSFILLTMGVLSQAQTLGLSATNGTVHDPSDAAIVGASGLPCVGEPARSLSSVLAIQPHPC